MKFVASARRSKKPRPRGNQNTAQSYFSAWAAQPDRAAQWRRPVSLIDKIPSLSDEEVINLLANARRLQTSGDEKQQAQAAELLGPLEEAADQRRTARLAATQAKRAARRPKKQAA
jgi:hypothetical protein